MPKDAGGGGGTAVVVEMKAAPYVVHLRRRGRRAHGMRRWSINVVARSCSAALAVCPLAREVAVCGSCHSIPAWCVVCGVHPPARDRVCVGTLSPVCLVLCPCVVASPKDRV